VVALESAQSRAPVSVSTLGHRPRHRAPWWRRSRILSRRQWAAPSSVVTIATSTSDKEEAPGSVGPSSVQSVREVRLLNTRADRSTRSGEARRERAPAARQRAGPCFQPRDTGGSLGDKLSLVFHEWKSEITPAQRAGDSPGRSPSASPMLTPFRPSARGHPSPSKQLRSRGTSTWAGSRVAEVPVWARNDAPFGAACYRSAREKRPPGCTRAPSLPRLPEKRRPCSLARRA
jgi:hypothetical protein